MTRKGSSTMTDAKVELVARAMYVAHAKYHGFPGERWDEEPAQSWMSWRNKAQAAITAFEQSDAVMGEALIAKATAVGSALDDWIRLLEPLNTTGEDGDPVLTGEYQWARNPTHAEAQEAMRANNALAELLAISTPIAPVQDDDAEWLRALAPQMIPSTEARFLRIADRLSRQAGGTK